MQPSPVCATLPLVEVSEIPALRQLLNNSTAFDSGVANPDPGEQAGPHTQISPDAYTARLRGRHREAGGQAAPIGDSREAATPRLSTRFFDVVPKLVTEALILGCVHRRAIPFSRRSVEDCGEDFADAVPPVLSGFISDASSPVSIIKEGVDG